MLVIDFYRFGGSEKKRGGSEKSHCSCCVITHVKCIHDTLKNNAYNVRKILWGSSNKLCINMHSHGQYEMANAWALAKGERERRRGEWVRWEEGGRVLYSVEPLFREPPQDQGI